MFSVRNLLCATAFALTTAAATHASAATQVFVDSVGEYNNAKIQVSGTGLNANLDGDALKLVVNLGVGPATPTFEVWAFCVDLYHFIDPGYFSQKTANLQYNVGDLTTDGAGNTLSASQVQQIYGLAALGYNLIKVGSPDLQNKLSGIQGAIWTIEYPTFTFTGNTSGLNAYIASYVAAAPSLNGNAYALLSADGRTQNFVVGVPEPATWAMMIIGFGAVGMVMRSRRRLAVAA